jgi:hypothetical protein
MIEKVRGLLARKVLTATSVRLIGRGCTAGRCRIDRLRPAVTTIETFFYIKRAPRFRGIPCSTYRDQLFAYPDPAAQRPRKRAGLRNRFTGF